MEISLQLFCAFYSHLGLQLTPVKFWNRSFWNLLWNLAVNITILYCLLFDDPFRLIEGAWGPPAEKPLLVMFSHYNSHYKYPLTYSLTAVYYHLFGRKIRRLLLKLLEQESYSSSSSSPVTGSSSSSSPKSSSLLSSFLVAFSLLHLLFLVGYSMVVRLYLTGVVSHSLPASLVALKWFTIYVNHFSAQFPLVAVHYALTAKGRTLEQIHRRLQYPLEAPNQLPNAQPLNRLKCCAQVHDALCRLIAFPLLVFLFSNSLDSIGAICAAKVHLNLSILFYQSAVFAFLLHLARLEGRSRATLSSGEVVKLRECAQVYQHQLHLHLFHLFTVEFSFTLSLALLILNYSVLVLQT